MSQACAISPACPRAQSEFCWKTPSYNLGRVVESQKKVYIYDIMF